MKISFFKIIFVLVFGVFCLSPFVVSADSTDNMTGYAWSSNIGWISFNCTNDDSCGSSNYGVNKNADDTLTGYAWSSNIGWIQFGTPSGGVVLSGWPNTTVAPGTTSSNAKVVGSNLVGWAKALSADGNGWDGWIALSGTGYGVTLSGNAFTGYAWGSDVVGWVDFNGVVVNNTLPELTASAPTPIMATVNIAQNYTSIITNSGASLAPGSIIHLFQYDDDANHLSGVSSTTSMSSAIFAGGTASVSNSRTFTTTGTKYIRVCADNNTSFEGTVSELDENNNCSPWTTITVSASSISVNLSASPASMTLPTNSTTLTWTTTGTPDSCIASNAWSGAKTTTGGSQNITGLVVGTYTYIITCSKAGTTNVSSASTVVVNSSGGSNTCFSTHYKCDDGSDGTNQISSPSKWTWKCGSTDCSEKKSPGYIER